jgi:hypothetical protein
VQIPTKMQSRTETARDYSLDQRPTYILNESGNNNFNMFKPSRPSTANFNAIQERRVEDEKVFQQNYSAIEKIAQFYLAQKTRDKAGPNLPAISSSATVTKRRLSVQIVPNYNPDPAVLREILTLLTEKSTLRRNSIKTEQDKAEIAARAVATQAIQAGANSEQIKQLTQFYHYNSTQTAQTPHNLHYSDASSNSPLYSSRSSKTSRLLREDTFIIDLLDKETPLEPELQSKFEQYCMELDISSLQQLVERILSELTPPERAVHPLSYASAALLSEVQRKLIEGVESVLSGEQNRCLNREKQLNYNSFIDPLANTERVQSQFLLQLQKFIKSGRLAHKVIKLLQQFYEALPIEVQTQQSSLDRANSVVPRLNLPGKNSGNTQHSSRNSARRPATAREIQLRRAEKLLESDAEKFLSNLNRISLDSANRESEENHQALSNQTNIKPINNGDNNDENKAPSQPIRPSTARPSPIKPSLALSRAALRRLQLHSHRATQLSAEEKRRQLHHGRAAAAEQQKLIEEKEFLAEMAGIQQNLAKESTDFGSVQVDIMQVLTGQMQISGINEALLLASNNQSEIADNSKVFKFQSTKESKFDDFVIKLFRNERRRVQNLQPINVKQLILYFNGVFEQQRTNSALRLRQYRAIAKELQRESLLRNNDSALRDAAVEKWHENHAENARNQPEFRLEQALHRSIPLEDIPINQWMPPTDQILPIYLQNHTKTLNKSTNLSPAVADPALAPPPHDFFPPLHIFSQLNLSLMELLPANSKLAADLQGIPLVLRPQPVTTALDRLDLWAERCIPQEAAEQLEQELLMAEEFDYSNVINREKFKEFLPQRAQREEARPSALVGGIEPLFPVIPAPSYHSLSVAPITRAELDRLISEKSQLGEAVEELNSAPATRKRRNSVTIAKKGLSSSSSGGGRKNRTRNRSNSLAERRNSVDLAGMLANLGEFEGFEGAGCSSSEEINSEEELRQGKAVKMDEVVEEKLGKALSLLREASSSEIQAHDLLNKALQGAGLLVNLAAPGESASPEARADHLDLKSLQEELISALSQIQQLQSVRSPAPGPALLPQESPQSEGLEKAVSRVSDGDEIFYDWSLSAQEELRREQRIMLEERQIFADNDVRKLNNPIAEQRINLAQFQPQKHRDFHQKERGEIKLELENRSKLIAQLQEIVRSQLRHIIESKYRDSLQFEPISTENTKKIKVKRGLRRRIYQLKREYSEMKKKLNEELRRQQQRNERTAAELLTQQQEAATLKLTEVKAVKEGEKIEVKPEKLEEVRETTPEQPNLELWMEFSLDDYEATAAAAIHLHNFNQLASQQQQNKLFEAELEARLLRIWQNLGWNSGYPAAKTFMLQQIEKYSQPQHAAQLSPLLDQLEPLSGLIFARETLIAQLDPTAPKLHCHTLRGVDYHSDLFRLTELIWDNLLALQRDLGETVQFIGLQGQNWLYTAKIQQDLDYSCCYLGLQLRQKISQEQPKSQFLSLSQARKQRQLRKLNLILNFGALSTATAVNSHYYRNFPLSSLPGQFLSPKAGENVVELPENLSQFTIQSNEFHSFLQQSAEFSWREKQQHKSAKFGEEQRELQQRVRVEIRREKFLSVLRVYGGALQRGDEEQGYLYGQQLQEKIARKEAEELAKLAEKVTAVEHPVEAVDAAEKAAIRPATLSILPPCAPSAVFLHRDSTTGLTSRSTRMQSALNSRAIHSARTGKSSRPGSSATASSHTSSLNSFAARRQMQLMQEIGL